MNIDLKFSNHKVYVQNSITCSISTTQPRDQSADMGTRQTLTDKTIP
jgi:hypothetical protein